MSKIKISIKHQNKAFLPLLSSFCPKIHNRSANLAPSSFLAKKSASPFEKCPTISVIGVSFFPQFTKKFLRSHKCKKFFVITPRVSQIMEASSQLFFVFPVRHTATNRDDDVELIAEVQSECADPIRSQSTRRLWDLGGPPRGLVSPSSRLTHTHTCIDRKRTHKGSRQGELQHHSVKLHWDGMQGTVGNRGLPPIYG